MRIETKRNDLVVLNSINHDHVYFTSALFLQNVMLIPKRRMGFINTLPFSALHLSRNAAIVSESLKISDQRMAKRY